MTDLTKIVEDLSSLTVIEAANLSKLLEEKWGVSAAIPVAAATESSSDKAEEVVEKTEFDIMLTAVGEKKINVIKAVRSITSLGLKEAKSLVDSAPTSIKQSVPKDVADKAKSELEAAGATVQIK